MMSDAATACGDRLHPKRNRLCSRFHFIEMRVGDDWPATMMTLITFVVDPSFAVTRIEPGGNGSRTIGGTNARPPAIT